MAVMVIFEFHEGPLTGTALEMPDSVDPPPSIVVASPAPAFGYRLESVDRERGKLIASYWPVDKPS